MTVYQTYEVTLIRTNFCFMARRFPFLTSALPKSAELRHSEQSSVTFIDLGSSEAAARIYPSLESLPYAGDISPRKN